MKHIITLILGALLAATAFSQTPPAETFIRGTITIQYNTRTQLDGDRPKEGVTDVYTLNLNVANNAGLKGTISHLPYVKYTIDTQKGQLTYGVDLDAINPKNPVQRLNVGKLVGTIPIDEDNVYRFSDGNTKASMFPVGRAAAFESAYGGLAAGKPPVKNGLWDKAVARAKGQPTKLAKTVNGKVQEINVTNYDRMEFNGHVLPAGPAQVFGAATVNGTTIFDYDRESWFFQNVIVTYQVDGRLEQDIITGNIRWAKASGEYQFDVRVDEPPPAAGAIFSGSTSTDDFFATDITIPSLVGTMKYKDSVNRGIVTSSDVVVDLKGNGLTTIQVVYLSKLLLLSMTVPLNAE